jgi:hypothetical protein
MQNISIQNTKKHNHLFESLMEYIGPWNFQIYLHLLVVDSR